VIDASQYGARQQRERLIVILVRKDVGVPSFPRPTKPDLSKVSVNALFPYVTHFSGGHFYNKVLSAKKKVFCTMTATGSELFFGEGTEKWEVTVEERLLLTEMDGMSTEGISKTKAKRGIGNAVQPSLMDAICSHLTTEVLKI